MSIIDQIVKRRHLPIKLYITGSYVKFRTSGKCLDYPRGIHIQTQSLCNGRCSICPYPITSKKLEQGIMEWSLFDKIATEVASTNKTLHTVLFELHNEPLMDKRTFSWVKHIKSVSRDKKCVVITNGELLDRYSPADILESKLDKLIISLNAHSREVYEVINNGLDYDKVVRNISRLIANKSTRAKVVLAFVLTKQNVHEVSEATQYWHRQGVRTRVSLPSNRAGSLDAYESIRPNINYNPVNLSLKVRQWLWTTVIGGTLECQYPFYSMSILFNGDAIICSHDWNRATVVGSVKNSSLKEIWNSERMNQIRRLMLKKRFEQIDSCKGCSVVHLECTKKGVH